MDEKTMDLFKQGKYFGAVKNYVDVITEEANNMQHVADPLFQQEQAEMSHHSSPRNTGGRNLNAGIQQRGKIHSINQGRTSHTSLTAHQNSRIHHKKTAKRKHQELKSLRPHHRPITKESIIKFERNSSVGSVSFALLMIVVLLVIFIFTL